MEVDRHTQQTPTSLGLQATAQRFRQLADWAPVSMAIFDLNMCYIELSQGWRDDCQIGARDVIGLSHYEIFPHLPEHWKDIHRRCLQGATERSESDLFLRPDGTSGWIRWEVKPWRDDFGNIGGIVMWTEDITIRKQAESIVQESERRFKSALANSQVSLWEQDVDLRYTWLYNPKLGYEINEVIGKTDSELIAPKYANTLNAIKRRVIESGQSSRQEVVTATPDGNLAFYDLWVEPLLNGSGQIIGVSCAASDISERKQVEETLRVLVSEKEALLKEVYHRVKNNMQVISSLLRLQSSRATSMDTRSVLEDMRARIRAMALVHESLYRSNTFASIDLGSYLQQLAVQSVEAQEATAGAVQLEFHLAQVQINLDQAITCGLLLNELISNCLKHGFPAGIPGHIRIDLQALELTKQWRLRLSDSGVGLPDNFEERRKNSLGLQLVTDLASQIGAEVTITPNLDKGVSFSIDFRVIEPATLPLQAQDPDMIAPINNPSITSQILIVEDETIIARDIAMQLLGLGYQTLGPVKTGEQAIELAGRFRPQLVLMDVHLATSMDGITAAQEIRNKFDIPCVFLSAFTEVESQIRAKLTYPAGYLAKPFSEQELRSVVAMALKGEKTRGL